MTARPSPASITRRSFALLGAGAVAVAVASCTDAPTDPRPDRTSTAEVGGYRPVAIGGGGWVTGFARSGATAYARTDVGGAYALSRRGTWRQLITFASVGKALAPSDYRVDAIACAARDPQRVAILVARSDTGSLGNLLRSEDGGRRWTRSSVRWPVDPTSDGGGGDRIAFDPADDDRLFVAAGDGHAFASDDFGATWRDLPVPSAASPADDGSGRLSAILATRPAGTQGPPVLWLGVTGSGLWRSADSGAGWQQVHPLADRTDRISDLQPVGDAVLLCVESTTGGGGLLRIPSGDGGATRIDLGGQVSVRSIAVDPDDPDRAFLVPSYVDASQVFLVSDDLTGERPGWRQQRWSIGTGGSSTWPPRVQFETLSSGQARFIDGRLLYAEGMGVWSVDAGAGTAVLTPASSGIEELVGNRVLKPADGPLLTASWDRGVLAVADPLAARPAVDPAARRGFGSAWDLAASPTDPSFVAAILDDHQDPTGRTVPERRASGFSTDGGRTWTRFAALEGDAPADLLFGNIAVSAEDSSNLVWLPSNLSGAASAVYWTSDRGATWTRARLSGLTDDDLLHPTFTLARKVLVADPKRAGRFTIVGSTREGVPVLWRSADGGASWSKAAARGSGAVRNAQYGTQVLPFGTGLLAVTGASDGGVLRVSDAGEWTSDRSVVGGVALTAGPGAASGSGQVVYLYADAGSRTGLHVSIDAARTWRRCAGPVLDLHAPVRSIAADPRVPGRVYLATGGNGYASIDVQRSYLR